jgi:hypothetical protein
MPLDLANCTACYGIRIELENQIEKISNIKKISDSSLKYLKEAIKNFKDDSYFDERLDFLQTESGNYISLLGEAAEVNETTFISDLKRTYKSTPAMQRNQFLNKALNLKIPSDIEHMKTISGSYASMMMLPILIGVVEKLAMDFNTHEFISGLNMSIIEFNVKVGGLKEIYNYTLENLTFLKINKCYHQRYINKWYTRIHNLLDFSYLNENIEINENKLYENLTPEQIEKINKVRNVCEIILLNSWNEIRIKTNINEMFIVNAYTGLS